MKKIPAVLLLILASFIIFISIMGLVKAFDQFATTEPVPEKIGYALGSILFPLLLTVTGRWLFRKGVELFRKK